MRVKNLVIIMSLTLLTSCQIYKKDFDCPIASGIPCQSVSEIESMIIEQEEGSDYLSCDEHPKEQRKQEVWIRQEISKEGNVTPERYFEVKTK